jgi:hypothetical protein
MAANDVSVGSVRVDGGTRECESPDYQEYRRLRYAWLYEDEDIWATPDPSLS